MDKSLWRSTKNSRSSRSIFLPGFGVQFFKNVWKILCIAIPCWRSASALFLLLLVAAAVGEKFLEYYVGLLPSQFYSVLPSRDRSRFMHLVVKSLGFVCGVAIVKGVGQFFGSITYILWRRELVSYLQDLYTSGNAFYELNVTWRPVDNPDQRITQDVDRFCKQFSSQLVKLVVTPFTIVFYSYKTFAEVGWFAPVFVYIFFILGVTVNHIFMSSLVPHVCQQEKLEGDFRYHHVRMRRESEAIAFSRSACLEHKKIMETFSSLFSTQQKIVVREFFLSMSVNLFDYLGSILSYLIIAIPILSGAYKDKELASIISASSFETIYLISQFTSLLDMSNSFSEIAGYAHRMAGLVDALREAGSDDGLASQCHMVSPSPSDFELSEASGLIRTEEGSAPMQSNSPDLLEGSSRVFKLHSVSYGPPSSSSFLIQDLNLEIRQGTGLLIMGTTGSGKSSLLRVLRGIWPATGIVHRYAMDRVIFVPQMPFLTRGSLHEQVAYPDKLLNTEPQSRRRRSSASGQSSEAPLLESTSVNESQRSSQDYALLCLHKAGLSGLVQRAGTVLQDLSWDWYESLSPGEVQRLSFARLFYHGPSVALLDESTSALSDVAALELFQQCVESGITLVAVMHHRLDGDEMFFSQKLSLDGHGGWTLQEL